MPVVAGLVAGRPVGLGSGPGIVEHRRFEISTVLVLTDGRIKDAVGQVALVTGHQDTVRPEPGAIVLQAVDGVGRAVGEPCLVMRRIEQTGSGSTSLTNGVTGGEAGFPPASGQLLRSPVPLTEVAKTIRPK